MTTVPAGQPAGNRETAEVAVVERTCSSCRFFRLIGGVTGRCHRMPPTWRVDAAVSEWPRVVLTDFCGEWRAHLEAPR